MPSAVFLAVLCASLTLFGCAQTTPSGAATTSAAPSTASLGTYANRETYAHASSDVSTSALISGGATSSGPAVAPSATAIEGRLKEWRLSPADITAEIASGHPIVRTKGVSGEAGAPPMADEPLLTLVNNRLVADADTGRVTTRLKIAHGEITIRGAASSAGLVGRAIAIALDTDGVTKVTSELKIDPRLPAALRDAP